jgi:hypothetical protein
MEEHDERKLQGGDLRDGKEFAVYNRVVIVPLVRVSNHPFLIQSLDQTSYFETLWGPFSLSLY